MAIIESLALRYEQQIYRLALRLTRNTDAAMLVTQQVFVHLSRLLSADPSLMVTVRLLYRIAMEQSDAFFYHVTVDR